MIIISSVCFPCLWLQNRHCVVSFGRIGSGFAHTLVKFIAKCSQSFFQVVAVVFFALVILVHLFGNARFACMLSFVFGWKESGVCHGLSKDRKL